MKKLILPSLGVGAWITAAVIGLAARSVEVTEVYLLTPHKADIVEVNQGLWELDTPDPAKTPNYERKVMDIYGVPGEAKEKLVFVDHNRLLHPKEKPDLALLPVDKEKGENPWQLKTVEFLARMLKGGAVITGALFLILFLLFQTAAPAPAARSAAAD